MAALTKSFTEPRCTATRGWLSRALLCQLQPEQLSAAMQAPMPQEQPVLGRFQQAWSYVWMRLPHALQAGSTLYSSTQAGYATDN